MEERSDLHRNPLLRWGLPGLVLPGWTSCSSEIPLKQLGGYGQDPQGSA